MKGDYMHEKITWLGHASFRIDAEKLMFIDPWKLTAEAQADIVLVSHSHYDHYSPDDIELVSGPDTVIVTVKELEDKFEDSTVHAMAQYDEITVDGVKIFAPPAYNLNKAFHTLESGWIGFVIEAGGQRLYYAGDTDAIPEMQELKDIDVALLPVGGTYTMTAEEAATAANGFKPKVAIPYHYGDIVGEQNDAERFAELFEGETVILEPQH